MNNDTMPENDKRHFPKIFPTLRWGKLATKIYTHT